MIDIKGWIDGKPGSINKDILLKGWSSLQEGYRD